MINTYDKEKLWEKLGINTYDPLTVSELILLMEKAGLVIVDKKDLEFINRTEDDLK